MAHAQRGEEYPPSTAEKPISLCLCAIETRCHLDEPMSALGSLNPFGDPAGENLTLLLLDAHRMLKFQSAQLLKIPAFVQLFQDAFPTEAAQATAANDPTILINDQTVLRATATFLRTVVTRNTPFDRFLAGDNNALNASERRGAQMFFTTAANGAGGAGCFTCHSGPMLNKQSDDADVAGIGGMSTRISSTSASAITRSRR
jgi:hypothetical protein